MARSASRTTTDHEEIRRWAEERGGQPAEVEGTERGANDTGIIRLDFPGYAGTPPLRHISWDDWFEKFDESGLALVYQERTAGGQKSNFNKLVARETAEARERGVRGASRRSARRGRAAGGRAAGGRGAAASKAGRASAAARRRKGTGRTRPTARRTTSRGEGQGRRKAPRASAARTAGRGAAKGRRAASGAAKRPAGGRRSAKSAARRGGRRASSRSRSR